MNTKLISILYMASVLLAVASCGSRTGKKTASEPSAETKVAEETETYYTAIDKHLTTAKKIFGENFEEFSRIYSDQTGREEARKNAIAAHVFKHNLPVKFYKDYGWPAVEIPNVP